MAEEIYALWKRKLETDRCCYDAGYSEWIFWSAGNNYTEEALLPEGQIQENEKKAIENEKNRKKNVEIKSKELENNLSPENSQEVTTTSETNNN